MFRRPGTDIVSEEGGAFLRARRKASSAARQLASTVKLFSSITRIFDRGRSPTDLAKWLEMPERELQDWIEGHPPEPRGRDFSYTEFTIPKRSGGARVIHAPSEGLKALQRKILHRLLNPLPVHPSATGFVPGRSIVTNALPHVGRGAVINIDLADFFPSITRERVLKAIGALGWNKKSGTILANICTHEDRLPQGAPSSPAISNIVCRRLDARLSALTNAEGGKYTRYADDLTISFPQFGGKRRSRSRKGKESDGAPPDQPARRRILTVIRRVIEDEGFKIQMKKKVRLQRPHQRQTATGLVVNIAVNLPRAVRRRIRAMQQHERKGLLDTAAKNRLRGWEALAAMISRQREA